MVPLWTERKGKGFYHEYVQEVGETPQCCVVGGAFGDAGFAECGAG